MKNSHSFLRSLRLIFLSNTNRTFVPQPEAMKMTALSLFLS